MTSSDAVFTWEQRLVGAVGLPLLLTAFVIAAAAFGLYLVVGLALEVPLMDWEGAQPLPLDDGTWIAFVHSLVLGFGVVGVTYALERNDQELVALEQVSHTRRAEDLRRMWVDTLRSTLPTSRVIGSITAFLVFLIPIFLAYQTAVEVSGDYALRAFAWFWAISPIMGWAAARAGYFTVRGMRAFSRQADEDISVDLLDTAPLAVFGRIGLRSALFWILGTTIYSLYFLNIPATYLVTAYPAILAVLLVSIAALIIPFLTVRRAIRREKAAELVRLRGHIRVAREQLGSSTPEAIRATSQLPALLAYETRILSVHEWPIDTPTLGRFMLYLGIPLFSWLGGAVVERLLAAAID